MKRILGIAVAVLLSCTAAHAACSDDEVADAAAAVKTARQALFALPSGGDLDGRVSPAGSRAIETFKDRIEAFAQTAMRCQPDEPTAQSVSTALNKFPDEAGDHAYGGGLAFEVRVPKSPSALVAVTARFGIKCGADAMLMIFERRGETWPQTLAARAKPYKTVDGGWWVFDYAISPPDRDGHWFVAVKHVAPWCSSTWSDIGYRLLRPSQDSARPAVLLNSHHFMWWGDDDYGRIKVARGAFEMRFTSAALDTENREFVRHYSVAGDVVRRTPPYADTPYGFVDDWLSGDWTDVGDWSLAANHAHLRSVHDAVAGASDKIHVLEYSSARACPGGRYQIELYDDTRHASDFFLTQGKEILLDATSRPDPRCNLPDTLDPQLPR